MPDSAVINTGTAFVDNKDLGTKLRGANLRLPKDVVVWVFVDQSTLGAKMEENVLRQSIERHSDRPGPRFVFGPVVKEWANPTEALKAYFDASSLLRTVDRYECLVHSRLLKPSRADSMVQ